MMKSVAHFKDDAINVRKSSIKSVVIFLRLLQINVCFSHGYYCYMYV